MKRIILTTLLAIGYVSAQAAGGGTARTHSIGSRSIVSHSSSSRSTGGSWSGSHSGGGSWSGSGNHWNGSHWNGGRHSSSSFYFSFGGYPYYAPGYFYSYPYYPGSYSYYPAYGYSYSYPAYGYDYGYSRPNYAVGGTLLGALAGGLIGDSIHHQGWEGAGIGAAAGLLLGGLAEHSARVQERNYYSAPAVSYASPNVYVGNGPTTSDPPAASAAPQVRNNPATYRPASAMSSANSLFGR